MHSFRSIPVWYTQPNCRRRAGWLELIHLKKSYHLILILTQEEKYPIGNHLLYQSVKSCWILNVRLNFRLYCRWKHVKNINWWNISLILYFRIQYNFYLLQKQYVVLQNTILFLSLKKAKSFSSTKFRVNQILFPLSTFTNV